MSELTSNIDNLGMMGTLRTKVIPAVLFSIGILTLPSCVDQITAAEAEAASQADADRITALVNDELPTYVQSMGESCVKSMNASIVLDRKSYEFSSNTAAVAIASACGGNGDVSATHHFKVLYEDYKSTIGDEIALALEAGFADDLHIDGSEHEKLVDIAARTYEWRISEGMEG